MASYLEKLIAEAKGFDWDEMPERVDPTQENSVVADTFDEMDWEFMRDGTPAVEDMIDRLEADHAESPPAVEDLFHMLHKTRPRFRDQEEMKPEYRANGSLLKSLFDSPEFQELRKDSVLDEYGTVFTLLILEPRVVEAFERLAEKREQEKQAAQQRQQAQEQLQQAQQQAQDAQNTGQGQDEAAAALQAAMGAVQDANQAAQDAADATAQTAEEAANDLAKAAGQAKDDLGEENDSMQGYGYGPGELKKMSFEERRALTKKLNQGKLAQFAKLIGQFREFANGERRRKVKTAPAEVYDYELGNDLTKLVAEEMNNLAIPEMEENFWLRWAQGGLLQKKVRGPQNAGQGPILVVCDESGSMGAVVDNDGNTREAWSKAITLALADQARQGKRDFTYIGFSSGGQQWRMDFPNGHTPIDQVSTFVEHFYCGGTEYTVPLSMALDIVNEYAQAGKEKPDIVFITDDDCSVPPDFIEAWRKAKDQIDIKVYGIQIGGHDQYGNMRKLSDRSIMLDKLNSNPEGMKELFRQV